VVEIIASVKAEGPAEMVRQARLAAMAGATWVELRLDDVPPPGSKGGVDPQAVLAQVQLPVLVTCRTERDGGTFAGGLDERRELLSAWLAAGAQGIDLEDWEQWTPPGACDLQLYLRSHHNRTGVTDNLPAVRDRLLQMGGHVAKIVVTAHDLADAAPVVNLLMTTDPNQQPTVAFAMGPTAWPTRVLACMLGAPLIYGSPAADLEVVPGQPPVAELTGIYDVRRISRTTALYGILGNPVQQSLSPVVHNRAFRLLEHDGIFLPFETSKPAAVIAMLPKSRLRGVSVTAPHKGVVASLCHQFDDDATQAEVVNTLTFQAHGVVMGHNTDVAGVAGALERAGLAPHDHDRDRDRDLAAAVLGGGGAARAAAVALKRLGLNVTLMPRSLDSVREFCKRQGHQLARLDAGVLTELRPHVVVHATPVGTTSTGSTASTEQPERLLSDWQPAAGTYVLDMVYRPRETSLLRDVAAHGAIPVAGLEMFLTQASRQLQLFTGRQVSEEVLGSFVAGT
jgi:3-dehydroquinate dehydratase/shikimate dehydrogenase